jgi:hypothetical protein
MDSLESLAAKADAEQLKAQQRASKKPEPSPMVSVVGREDGVLLVNRGGVIQPATNNTTAGLGIGESVAQGEGTYLEVISPEPFTPAFPVFPLVVQRRRASKETILPFIYSASFVENVNVLQNGSPATVELTGERLWLHTRDQTVEEVPPSIFFWEIKTKGYRTLGSTQGNSRFEIEVITTSSNGGCDGLTYETYSYNVTSSAGESGEVFITEDVDFIPHTLRLAPGDTGVRYQETGGHGGGGSALDGVFYRTSAEASRFASVHIHVPPPGLNSDFRSTQPALYSYLWSLTSWPSEQYSISGTGLKIAANQNFATQLIASGSLPFCGGRTFIAASDPASHSPSFSATRSTIVPIVSAFEPENSYLSSGGQREYLHICSDLQPQITEQNDPFLDAATQSNLRTVLLPDKVRDSLTSGSISLGMFEAGGQSNGVTTPSILIPSKSCTYSAYVRDLEAIPITAEIRSVTEDDLAIDGWNEDWRYPLQQSPVIWSSPCFEQYATEPLANISSFLFQAQPSDLQNIVSSPLGLGVATPFTATPLSINNGDCFAGTATEKAITLPGLGIADAVTIRLAAPNIVPRKYGRKNLEP